MCDDLLYVRSAAQACGHNMQVQSRCLSEQTGLALLFLPFYFELPFLHPKIFEALTPATDGLKSDGQKSHSHDTTPFLANSRVYVAQASRYLVYRRLSCTFDIVGNFTNATPANTTGSTNVDSATIDCSGGTLKVVGGPALKPFLSSFTGQ